MLLAKYYFVYVFIEFEFIHSMYSLAIKYIGFSCVLNRFISNHKLIYTKLDNNKKRLHIDHLLKLKMLQQVSRVEEFSCGIKNKSKVFNNRLRCGGRGGRRGGEQRASGHPWAGNRSHRRPR